VLDKFLVLAHLFWHSFPMMLVMRFLEFLGLGFWLGSDVFLSFVVAPGAFRVLGSRDQAGTMVGYSLTCMHLGGILCGVVILIARMLRVRGLGAWVSGPAICVAVMILLTAISQYTVSARMADLRVRMGSIAATDFSSPLLAEFTRLHGISVGLESGVLLAGFAAMFQMVRESFPQ
jgi:Domain of unknown function (DUF4149)